MPSRTDAATLDTEGMVGVIVDGEMLPVLRYCERLMDLLAFRDDGISVSVLWIPAEETD